MHLSAALASLCLLCLHHAGASVVKRAATPTVSIASGVVIGTSTTVAGSPTASVAAYLGIPYAALPQRFSPASPPAPWTKPLVAQELSPICMQQFVVLAPGTPFRENTIKWFSNPGGSPPAESEDCLYINVYAPPTASASNRKPVLFWIYGGNLMFGGGSILAFNGTRLAYENDVVVVTFNYRTNIFGFSSSPQIPFGQQNVGYLDQRLALSWVRDNIANFGGDPARVTIFGESAGAYSVKQLLANPPQPLPFRAAIMESPATTLTGGGGGTTAYLQTLAQFNCATALSPLDCLRKVPAKDLIAYIEPNSLMFAPVDGDGTQSYDIRQSVLTGRWARVPLVIGNNLNEGRVFVAALGYDTPTAPLVTSTLETLLGTTNTSAVQSILASVRTSYPPSTLASTYLLYSQILTDFQFTCPISTLSTFLAANGIPVWRYLFSAVFPNVNYFDNPGAYHGSEVPEVWGTYDSTGAAGAATPTQVQLSRFMRAAWTGFARNPLLGPGWPAVGTNFGMELQDFGAGGGAGAGLAPTGSVDYVCAVYDPLDMALQKSY